MFSTAARRLTTAGVRSVGARCLSTSAKTASRSMNKNALPFLFAGGLTAFGLTQYNQSQSAQCDTAAGDDSKAVENKFATYWPRNILILFGPP